MIDGDVEVSVVCVRGEGWESEEVSAERLFAKQDPEDEDYDAFVQDELIQSGVCTTGQPEVLGLPLFEGFHDPVWDDGVAHYDNLPQCRECEAVLSTDICGRDGKGWPRGNEYEAIIYAQMRL